MNQIRIDLRPWTGNRHTQGCLERIKTALQERRLLSFEYVDRHGNTTARTVEPYRLVLKSSHWYFQGYCRKRKDFRLFRVSRIAKLHLQEQVFTPRACPERQMDFSDILEAMQTTIAIRIHRSVLERVLEQCSLDDCTPDGEAHYIVRYPFIENDYHYNMLFSYGDACECLEPPHVRVEIKRRIQDIAALYEH